MPSESHLDIFPYFWLTLVAGFGVTNLVWAYYEFRRGVARWGWAGARYSRAEEPFYYWMAVGGRFFGFVVACFMFWFGLGMLNW